MDCLFVEFSQFLARLLVVGFEAVFPHLTISLGRSFQTFGVARALPARLMSRCKRFGERLLISRRGNSIDTVLLGIRWAQLDQHIVAGRVRVRVRPVIMDVGGARPVKTVGKRVYRNGFARLGICGCPIDTTDLAKPVPPFTKS
jgi:hypothetical protein